MAEAEQIKEPKQEKTEAPDRNMKATHRQDDESDRFGANIKHMHDRTRPEVPIIDPGAAAVMLVTSGRSTSGT